MSIAAKVIVILGLIVVSFFLMVGVAVIIAFLFNEYGDEADEIYRKREDHPVKERSTNNNRNSNN